MTKYMIWRNGQFLPDMYEDVDSAIANAVDGDQIATVAFGRTMPERFSTEFRQRLINDNVLAYHAAMAISGDGLDRDMAHSDLMEMPEDDFVEAMMNVGKRMVADPVAYVLMLETMGLQDEDDEDEDVRQAMIEGKAFWMNQLFLFDSGKEVRDAVTNKPLTREEILAVIDSLKEEA